MESSVKRRRLDADGQVSASEGDPSKRSTRKTVSLAAEDDDDLETLPELVATSSNEAIEETSFQSSLLRLDRLGDELIIKIFSFLRLKDLIRSVARVSKKWSRLSRAPELWRHIVLDLNKLQLKEGLDYRPRLIDDGILEKFTSLSNGVISVDLTDCNALSQEALISLSLRCRSLRRLNLTRLNVSHSTLDAIVTNCRHLEEVVLDNCGVVEDVDVFAIAFNCPKITKLSLANNSITDEALQHIASHLPNLRYLRIDHCRPRVPVDLVTDAGLHRLVAGCRRLEDLNISGIHGLSAKGLSALASLETLVSLDVARVQAGRVASPSNASQLASVLSALLSVAEANPRLSYLNASLFSTVDDSFVDNLVRRAKRLKQLFLVSSTDLTDRALESLAVHGRHLEKLDVSWCPRLTDEGVRHLVSRRPTLRTLGLIRCDAVSDSCVDALMEEHPSVEFQTFTLGCRQLLLRAGVKRICRSPTEAAFDRSSSSSSSSRVVS